MYKVSGVICCRMDGVDGKKRPRHQQEQNVISMWKSRRDRLWHGPQRTHSRKVRGRVERRALAFLGTWGMCSRVCLFQQRQTSIQCENAPRVQTSSGLHRSMSYLRSDAKARWKSSREGQEAHAHDMQTKSGGTRSGAARPDALRRAGLRLGKAEAIANSARPACARQAVVCLADHKSPLSHALA
jgi:hypothetical protein